MTKSPHINIYIQCWHISLTDCTLNQWHIQSGATTMDITHHKITHALHKYIHMLAGLDITILFLGASSSTVTSDQVCSLQPAMGGAAESSHVRDKITPDLHQHISYGNTVQILHTTNGEKDEDKLLHSQLGPRMNTALHLAIIYNHKDLAKTLVEEGASITILNEDDHMPITYYPDGKCFTCYSLPIIRQC